MKTIQEKLAYIQANLKVSKNRVNNFGKYNYRSAEDILEALKPFIESHKVIVTIKEKLLGDGLLMSTAKITCTEDGRSIKATAVVGVDFEQKGMAMSQRYGASSSYAKKYALGNLFLIDDTADADAVNTHGKTEGKKPNITKEQLSKAKAFLDKGGSINAIKQKYNLSKSDVDFLTVK
jgi:hypothetical protein